VFDRNAGHPWQAPLFVVENAVQVAQRWIVAALRQRKFFALEELNGAIRELLEKLNRRPFRKREGNRATVFQAKSHPAHLE
jgi:hypothetical protein